MTNQESKERFDFEHALGRLSEVLKELESDDVPLEKAIALYEEGMKLSKLCSKKLEEAELRIVQVTSKENH
ncbi:MAG: exodeoxyribonuclease VII small subunit [Cyclonatronaceae bacterium]